jgi:phosphoserine phosphatase RsbU/P
VTRVARGRVTQDEELLEQSAEELFEDAPCGYLTCGIDGTILRVNRTFEHWTGYDRSTLLGTRFRDLLAPAGRIYHETHYVPLLQMQGAVREIALDLVRADGTRLPALINSVQGQDEAGRARIIRTTIFDATDRRAYEQELLRARRREQETAQLLQRSLLSGEPPLSKDLCVEVFYRPAQGGYEVGGDWHDAFWLEDERIAGLVVGDVVGRGLEAAAVMGQLRSAVRALASTGLPPGPLLDALDGFVSRHRVGRMTTVAYAQLDVGSGELLYACAGHPPPVLIAPDEQPPSFLWEGRSVPLDSVALAGPRRQAAAQLARGGTLLLYTDALVERRQQSLDVGLEHLLAEAAGHAGEDIAQMLTDIVRAMNDDRSDDLCLLAAHRRG